MSGFSRADTYEWQTLGMSRSHDCALHQRLYIPPSAHQRQRSDLQQSAIWWIIIKSDISIITNSKPGIIIAISLLRILYLNQDIISIFRLKRQSFSNKKIWISSNFENIMEKEQILQYSSFFLMITFLRYIRWRIYHQIIWLLAQLMFVLKKRTNKNWVIVTDKCPINV